VLQRFDFTYSSPQATPLSTRHSLSALPSDESVELVGCLMYLMTCTRPDLAYPLSILACYVAPGRHRPEHMAAAKRVLRYLCSTSSLGLVLGERRPVVLTGHADSSWADDQASQWSSQGYTFSLGSGSVSWWSTRSSSVLGSSCEAEIYAGAIAAQELRWLTYLLADLGEPPRSPPVLYVDNKAMLALCREHRLEHRTKHIALRYFLARELQQRGQLRLAYVASEANTADIFTKALPPGDHQRFCTMLACFALLDWSCDLLFSPTLPMGVRTASKFVTAIKARYATPTTLSLGRLFLPFLFPDLASFECSADLIAHLRSLDSSYRSVCTDAQLALLPPPMAITIYFITTSLPDRLALVRDVFLLKNPSKLTIAILESALKDIKRNLCSVASASGAVPPDCSTELGVAGGAARVRAAAEAVEVALRAAAGAAAGVRTASAVACHVGVWIEPSGDTATCVDGDTYAPLATFHAGPGSGLYTIHTSPQAAAATSDPSSSPVAASSSYRSLAHPTVLYHHHLGHPSIPRLRTMSSQRLVLGLPRVLPSLPPSLAPPCAPCVEGRLRAIPHSSSLRPATEPFKTLHLDVWGLASCPGPERASFFFVDVDDYSRYTTVFPLAKTSDVTSTLIRWLLTTEGTRGCRVSSPSPQSSLQSLQQPSALPPKAAADREGAGIRSADPGDATSRGVGVGAESVPARDSGAGGARVGAEPGSARAGPGEPGPGRVAAGGAGSGGGVSGALESGPGATTSPDTTPPPHPYPTRHQARLCCAREEQLELKREGLELERQQLELQQMEERQQQEQQAQQPPHQEQQR
ncbi:unnamed protein product, partial [Closterium sp. NIES-53]